MSENQTNDRQSSERPGRRRLLKAGAALVPAIVTLRARQVAAQDGINLAYENREYVYGINAGLTSEQVHANDGDDD